MIENLVRICSGELLQKPSVSALANFTTDSSKVTRGSAYFSLDTNKDSINEAILNGAYAVISQKDILVKDKEIAYIKVDSVQKAMLRLMRYEIERKELQVVLSSLLQFDMLKVFKLYFESYFETDNIEEFFKLIFEAETKSYIFCKNIEVVEQIAPKYLKIEQTFNATILQSHMLFRSSFVCKDYMFRDFSLAPLFIPDFSAIISFLDKYSLSYHVESMEKCNHFEPHFVNSAMRKKPFGSTHQAIIIETDTSLFEKEVAWLEEKSQIEHVTILAPHNVQTFVKCKRYTSPQVLQTINPTSFRYLLMLGDKKQIIETLEAPLVTNPTLF